MLEGFDPTEIIACALRPQGSWIHMLTLSGFALAAWSVSPTREASRVRVEGRR
jgi:hypothetical protein